MEPQGKQQPANLAWYAVRTQTKREHIAAAAIRARAGLEVFCPRITFMRKTRRGRVRFTEALFPGYIFVHCDMGLHQRHLLAMQGVQDIVRYGGELPAVPDGFISELRVEMPEEHIETRDAVIEEGSEVVITEGPFMDIKAIVSGVIPAGNRVNLLLELLGRQVSMDMPVEAVFATEQQPKAFLRKPPG